MHNESRPIRPDLNRLRRHALSNQEAEDTVKYIKTLEAELAALRGDALVALGLALAALNPAADEGER